MAGHAPLLFVVVAVLAVAAASASAYVRAADRELIIGDDDDVFGLGGVTGRRRLDDDLNGTSPDAANATSADANSTSADDATRTEYISYRALSRDSVPCSRRGASYYSCQRGAEANPYTRGCSDITRCRG